MPLYYDGELVSGPQGPAGPDGNPVGTVISFMGTSAPKDYLVCDGVEYDISEYPALAALFQEQFGTAGHFGGDGETTFAVPDMRNLFLRGYHGNANEELSGQIGEIQPATIHESVPKGISTDPQSGFYLTVSKKTVGAPNFNQESTLNMDTATKANKTAPIFTGTSSIESTDERVDTYTARPVNMAVLYCIKAVESSPEENVYSTEETKIGTWVDGKPIYKKTIIFKDVSIPSNNLNLNPGIVALQDSEIETLIACSCRFTPIGTSDTSCTIGSLVSGHLRLFNNYSNHEFYCSGTFTLKYTKTTD